ncbi:MAG: choline ABC transporter permease subunit [Gammaproteobacteria bacterium]|jgi:glycine betaine/proline transport system permease protein|nr:choline ABC transporter permease subunit [Gammaproteobacteria bacterium]MDX2462004.1 choline ABC transporter permease subunit [Gammaproteobacteria bacterium]
MDWLESNKIPIGRWLADLVEFLNEYLFWFFDGFTIALEYVFDLTSYVLLSIPAFAMIALIAGAAYWLHRSWKISLFIVLSMLLIVNLGYWDDTMETLSLVIWATVLCVAIGVPVGIAAAHRPRLWVSIRPILDMMQTIPTFVYLIPALTLFGLGPVPGVVATVIFVVPAPIRLTYLGIYSTPGPMIEAAESFGATKKQLLWKVEMPAAMPSIMAGLTQTIMLSLSMVVIASMVAAPGLGIPILRAINQVNPAKGFEAGIAIVIVAIIMDRVCKLPDKKNRK